MNKVIVLVIMLIGLSRIASGQQVISEEEIGSKKESEEDRVFTIVEQPAQFPGGTNALYEYLKKNFKYPEDARRDSITGKVFVEFVVNKTGLIPLNSIIILRSLYPSCDEEVVRLVKGFPKWTPGKQNGKPVNSKFVLPLTFKFE